VTELRTTTGGEVSQPPPLSVILVAYNSRNDLERCLPSLVAQSVSHEVIVVDNSPGDGTAEWLADSFPDVRVIVPHANDGYAGGNNAGIRAARGELVLVLNPDTVVLPGALEALVSTAQTHPTAFVTPKILTDDGRVNACGNRMHFTGITTCLGLGEPADAYRGVFSVPLLSGAAILAHRDAWKALDGFDESYFMYFEDTDLSLRARLLGFPLLCNADAVVVHAYAPTMTPRKLFYLERNRLLTLFKIYDDRTLRRAVIGLIVTELATCAFAALRGREFIRSRADVYRSLWRRRHAMRAARARVQQSRTCEDRALFSGQDTALPLAQLMGDSRLTQLLTRITAHLYRALQPA
jgi:GT2 family glycosyltransferase